MQHFEMNSSEDGANPLAIKKNKDFGTLFMVFLK